MNAIANNIRISELPYYVKCSSSRHVLPELNCLWDGDVRRCYPFVLAVTGNIATAETFPYNRKDYRRTGLRYHFTRRAIIVNHQFVWHQLSYVFDILENTHTGERVAILHDVIRGGDTY